MKWGKNCEKGFMCFVAFLIGSQLLMGSPGIAAGADNRIIPASAEGSVSASAPDFELRDLNGSMFRLSKYKGDRYVLLYFWATWCPYCVAVKPQIAKLRETIALDRMEILAIDVGGGDTLEKLKRYQEGHPAAWPVLYDGDGVATKVYQIQGIPLFVLVDKDGNVAYRGNALPQDLGKFMK